MRVIRTKRTAVLCLALIHQPCVLNRTFAILNTELRRPCVALGKVAKKYYILNPIGRVCDEKFSPVFQKEGYSLETTVCSVWVIECWDFIQGVTSPNPGSKRF